MKAIIFVFICVALLHTTIRVSSGNDDNPNFYGYEGELALIKVQARVDEIFKYGGTIDRKFKPSKYLGRGSFAIIYEGKLVGAINKTVAMKISPTIMMEASGTVDELEMYDCMDAINNPAVENYGIPAVYYYGEWENCSMIAITLLDSQLNAIINARGFTLKELDILIIFREFVRISKYMHSRDVCHNDINLDNLMFRKHQGFLIDFNISKEGVEIVGDCRKTDWDDFLISMCLASGIAVDTPEKILENVAKLKHSGLKRVFSKFGKYVYQGGLQNYNRMYEIITEEIHRCGGKEPALVSWLTDEQKREAKAEWTKNPTPDIQSIDEPQ